MELCIYIPAKEVWMGVYKIDCNKEGGWYVGKEFVGWTV